MAFTTLQVKRAIADQQQRLGDRSNVKLQSLNVQINMHLERDVLKQRFKVWTAFVLSGSKELSQAIGLKLSQRFAVYNGTLPD